MIELSQSRLFRQPPVDEQNSHVQIQSALGRGRLLTVLSSMAEPRSRLSEHLLLGLGWMAALVGLGIFLINIGALIPGIVLICIALAGPSPAMGLVGIRLEAARKRVQLRLGQQGLAASVGLAWADNGCLDTASGTSAGKHPLQRPLPSGGAKLESELRAALQHAADALAHSLGWQLPGRQRERMFWWLVLSVLLMLGLMIGGWKLAAIGLPALCAVAMGYYGLLNDMLVHEVSQKLLADLLED